MSVREPESRLRAARVRTLSIALLCGLALAPHGVAEEAPERTLDALVGALAADTVPARRAAAHALWLRRSETEPYAVAIAAGLRDDDPYVRTTCAGVLRARLFRTPDAVPGVAEALADARVDVRRTASELLPWAYSQVEAVRDVVARALGDDDPEVRMHAARGLAMLPPERAAPVLSALHDRRSDPEPAVRAATLHALCKLDPNQGPASAAAALDDESATVREEALRALLLPGRAPEASVDLVCRLLQGDENEPVRRRAALLLSQYGAAADTAVPALIRAWNEDTLPVRITATRSLALLAPLDARALPTLSEALWDDSPWIVRGAASGLAAVGPEAAPYAPDLCHVLRAVDDSGARHGAAIALARVLEPLVHEARDALEEAADHRGDAVHVSAAASLVRLFGDTARLQQLVDALGSESHALTAAHALRALGPLARPALPALERLDLDPGSVQGAVIAETVAELRAAKTESGGR